MASSVYFGVFSLAWPPLPPPALTPSSDFFTPTAEPSILGTRLEEEFRPWLADRLAVTLIACSSFSGVRAAPAAIGPGDFRDREGGAVEFTEAGRKR